MFQKSQHFLPPYTSTFGMCPTNTMWTLFSSLPSRHESSSCVTKGTDSHQCASNDTYTQLANLNLPLEDRAPSMWPSKHTNSPRLCSPHTRTSSLVFMTLEKLFLHNRCGLCKSCLHLPFMKILESMSRTTWGTAWCIPK